VLQKTLNENFYNTSYLVWLKFKNPFLTENGEKRISEFQTKWIAGAQ
jgi:hypothetical protein